MGLMDLIRKAEEQSRSAARRGRELARTTLNESGRMLRRKMRVNPPANSTKEPATNTQTPDSLEANVAGSPPTSGSSPKRIISIHGKDMRTEEVPAPGRRRSA